MDALGAGAVDDQPDLLVIGGGDGTVGGAAGLVAGPRTRSASCPGTANDFARTLELPAELPAACDTVATGKVVDIDLGRVDGRAYLNVASVGLSVAVTERLTPGLKRHLGRWRTPPPRSRPTAARRPSGPAWSSTTAPAFELAGPAAGGRRQRPPLRRRNTVSPTAWIDDHVLDIYAIGRGRVRDHVTSRACSSTAASSSTTGCTT